MKVKPENLRDVILSSLQICLLLYLPFTTFSQTNEGTEFWFSFLEHRNPRLNTKVAMITSRVNTSGVIRAPLSNFEMPFSVAANDVTIVELPEFAETFGSESISRNGIQVIANDLVSVYIHQYHEFRAEATVVLPISSIDRSYYTMSYTGYFTEGQHFPSQFLIVANEDDTNVSIRLSAKTAGGRNRGATFTIRLNAGETYQVQGRNPSDDLSGSFIRGDKVFSVFCGNQYTALSCLRSGRDNLLEQALPISTWGTRFVSAPFQTGIDDIFRVLAAESNTRVEVYFNDGSRSEFRLDAGGFEEYEDDRISYIESSKPILVAQYINQLDCGNGSTGDPSMLYLNSILQIRDTVTLYNSSFQNIQENFINIITRTSDTALVEFDGQPITNFSSSIKLAGRNQEFATITFRVNTGAHTITSSGCGVIAKAYGLGIYESYAYSGGASFIRLNASPIPEGGCLNDTVFFSTGLPAERYDVQWVFDDGEVVEDHEFFRFYDELGSFGTQLNIHDRCFDLFDTLQGNLDISLRQSVSTDPVSFFCDGDTIQFSATDVDRANYEWRGPNDYFAEEQSPVLSGVKPEQSGIYNVIGIVSGCATFPAEVAVQIWGSPAPDLGQDRVFCPKSEEETIISPGSFETYLWEDGSSVSRLLIQAEGEYHVTVSDENGCKNIDTLLLRQQCPTDFYIPNVFTPNNDRVNDEFGVFGEDIISIDLNIYDSFGNKVFHSLNENNLWNGTYRNKMAMIGVYVWTLDLAGYNDDGSTFERSLAGDVSLIR